MLRECEDSNILCYAEISTPNIADKTGKIKILNKKLPKHLEKSGKGVTFALAKPKRHVNGGIAQLVRASDS